MTGKNKPKYKRVAQLKNADDFQNHMMEIGAELPFDAEWNAKPFAKSIDLKSERTIGNSMCILPMEGWDGTSDGKPTDHTKRRWKNFAISGAKLLWGCEAVAVRPSGRANPHQLMINEANFQDFVDLYNLLISEHEAAFDTADNLVIGLQLTHSGRFCKPTDHKKWEPHILYSHPILNKKFGFKDDYPVMSDEDIDSLIQDYINAAVLAKKAGFHFVDIKHCHGYLGHEFLSSHDREGKFGGSFENRTRFLKDIVSGINTAAPGLEIGIRLSVFDWVPFKADEDGIGVPASGESIYNYAFGGAKNGLGEDLTEPKRFLELAQSLGIQLICLTAGSPYYNPHIIRPALFPPSDGYTPPEDPFLGVARQIKATAEIKSAFPDLVIVGSAYSYLQEWLPNVAHRVLNEGMADSIGFGRMVLSYPEMPFDILQENTLTRNKICRTFSDCTTAPRNGMISGCFPLDPYYKQMPIHADLKALK